MIFIGFLMKIAAAGALTTFVGDELRMLGRSLFAGKHANRSKLIQKNHKYFE